MDEQAKRDLRNVIVFALADGRLSEQERRFIDSLRAKLGISEAEFAALCQQVRQDPKRLSLPREAEQARKAVRLLAETATADGEVSQAERELLRRLAAKAGLGEGEIDALIAPAGGDEDRVAALADEMYAHFVEWDEPARAEKLAALAGLGREAVMPLLHVLESYRVPDGAADNLELKRLVVVQLGNLGDERTAYYLAQQVGLGDVEDEISNAALRYAAAEALGRIVGQGFTADQPGLEAARAWWFGGGVRRYDRLAY